MQNYGVFFNHHSKHVNAQCPINFLMRELACYLPLLFPADSKADGMIRAQTLETTWGNLQGAKDHFKGFSRY